MQIKEDTNWNLKISLLARSKSLPPGWEIEEKFMSSVGGINSGILQSYQKSTGYDIKANGVVVARLNKIDAYPSHSPLLFFSNDESVNAHIKYYLNEAYEAAVLVDEEARKKQREELDKKIREAVFGKPPRAEDCM